MREEQETILKLKHQQLQQSRQEQHQIRKKAPRDNTSSILHSIIVKQDNYRKSISIRERIGSWLYNSIKCSNTDISYVQKLQQLERKSSISISQTLIKKQTVDKIVKIKIIQTSRLKLDSNVLHPFVKIHIVDRRNGCYIKKQYQNNQSIIYHEQNITFYQNRKYDTCQNNIVLPFATNLCDFRKMGNSICKWNQKFFVNFAAHHILHVDTLILFQLLDFNHQALLFKDNGSYDRDNYYRIAWGYLRPIGLTKTHFGINKIQLYNYKFNNKKQYNDNKTYIPSVYYDFIWNNHDKYQGYLSVQILCVSPPQYRQIDQQAQYPHNLFQEDIIDPTYLSRIQGHQDDRPDQVVAANSNLLRFFRNQGKCQIAKDLVYKLQSEKLGCFRTLFIGNYLYAACCNKKWTNIKVFSLESGQKVMTMKGHRQILYSMTTTPNQKYLITAGSDFFVRIWQLPVNFGQYIDQQQSQALIRAQIIHTAAVYSCACIHVPLNDKFYVLTCCYDGFVRLWQANLASKSCECVKEDIIYDAQKLPYKNFPISSVVSDSNFFIVGDSAGEIRIYDFAHNTLNLRCRLRSEQLKDDAINWIKIINKNNILVQASDNLIRHFQLSANKLRLAQKYSGAQFQTHLCDFAVSPDNRYLLSPSQTGKPKMWDLLSAAPVSLQHLNLDIKGPLITASWHSKYNLISFGGFVQLCPVLVYGNVLSETEQKLVAAQVI